MGCSNITSRAFGITNDWNFEADVILWNISNITANKVMTDLFESFTNNNPEGVIVSNYAINDSINTGSTLQERMKRLITEINDISALIE